MQSLTHDRPPFSPGISIAAALQTGLLHQQAGRLEAAREIYQRVRELEPTNAGAVELLGLLAHREGRGREAVELLREAVRLSPLTADWHNNLGIVLNDRAIDKAAGGEAVEPFRRAIELKPEFAEAHCNLGLALLRLGRPAAAERSFREALRLKPGYYEAAFQMGIAAEKLGDAAGAVAGYRRAVEIRPQSRLAWGNLLLAMNYSDAFGAEEIFRAHQDWGVRFAAEIFQKREEERPLTLTLPPAYRGEGTSGKMRIGYISGEFRDHPGARFLGPVLAQHDRERFEIACYSDVRQPDAQTAWFKAHADQWRSIVGMSDERVAEMIRADGIDVLIDRSGHMEDNRLGVFARRAAAVQMLYPGYPGTSGLAEMDYCLTDVQRDPPGSEIYYTEKLIRIPGESQCYDPATLGEEPPAVGPLPMDRNGFVTFGCFNRLVKVTPTTIEAWAKVMKAVGGSRLLLLAESEEETGEARDARARLHAQFAASGVDPGRVDFESRKPRRDYLALHHRIDIALDTFPYHGHTTTLDALWMGVGTVTLTGSTRAAREGAAMMEAVGLADWATDSVEQFVARAVDLATNPTHLRELRVNLRDKMRRSSLMDAARVAKGIEAACRYAGYNVRTEKGRDCR